ncbi:alpha/beta fold hydrolase [Biformimicrobium ophioploci]|uniref:AB hydrolase-1 domain-containing protein n=1 Tax=Biformimicrobium ophioploci TaxID=3036711 RepID=A0ABQ6LW70_9GAMM|nr:alpha/beta hydrolase [Microbulbifer sp. NKW57]GMG86308.1 hypothetical protein MNKW57_06290 [Microbulbifer sp. NKW57]
MALSAEGIRRGYLDADCGQLHYRICGEVSAPLLLLLHQTPSASEMYEPIMARLAKNFLVVALDTPGFGSSDALVGEFSIAAVARTIQAAVAREFGGPVLVFGHHTGAAIAVQLAFDYPQFVRAIALCGPTLLSEQQRKQLPATASPIALCESGVHWQEMWLRLRNKDFDAPLSLSMRETLLAFKCGSAYQDSYCAVVEQDTAAQMRAIECPVLLFAGDRDPLLASVAQSAQLLRNSHVATIPASAGTYICETQADTVAELLNSYFQKIDGPVESEAALAGLSSH